MRRWLATMAVMAVVTILACGCSDAPKSPFSYVYGTGVGPWVTRPGWESGYLYGDADNISHAVLTIDSVSLRGPGVGDVVALAEVKIAPLVAGPHATPGGQYQTQPPVFLGAECHKQALKPVAGYKMPPGAQFRLYIVIRALRPGRWNIPRQVVTYTMNGNTYQHVFPIRYWGTVRPGAPVLPIADYAQAACVGPAGARYLDYYRPRHLRHQGTTKP